MENKNFMEIIHGTEYAAKMKLFDNEIDKLENDNIDFFKERKPKRKIQKHDKIRNHFTTLKTPMLNTFNIALNFTSEDLPNHIHKEIVNIFNKIWWVK